MAKVMVEVKQVDLKTFRTMFGIPEHTVHVGYTPRIFRHTSWVRNGTLM